MKNNTFLRVIIGIIIVALVSILYIKIANNLSSNLDATPTPTSIILGIEYKNAEYGFSFNLPESWSGYSTSTSKWVGSSLNASAGDKPFTEGPLLLIHHPSWSGEKSRQDIPVMIFTVNQWEMQIKGKYYIGAAPIGPTKLGENSKYVFALPARYNYAFLPGYEEVEKILEQKPLQAF